MTRLDEIREREKKATKGPWKADGKIVRPISEEIKRRAPIAMTDCSHGIGQAGVSDENNADFIAHSREDIPYLLERLEAAEEALRGQCDCNSSFGGPLCDSCEYFTKWDT